MPSPSIKLSWGGGSSEEWIFLPMCVLHASKGSYLFPPMSPCVQSGLWHWWWLCHYFALGALAHLQSWCTSSLLRWHTSHIANASLALLPACLARQECPNPGFFSFCSFVYYDEPLFIFPVLPCFPELQMSWAHKSPLKGLWGKVEEVGGMCVNLF